MFGALAGARASTSMTFLSSAAIQTNVVDQLNIKKLIGEVSSCRDIGKSDMIHNKYQPDIEVDPQTYVVKADGQELSCEPATELPLAQLYHLF